MDTPNDPDFNYQETDPNLILDFTGENGDLSFRRLWHLTDTSAFEGWSIWPNKWYTAANKPADAPLIAIVDTGADMDHPDFVNAGGTGSDVSQGGQWVKSLSTRFSLGAPVDNDTNDLNGHGTHVSGLALASGNNGGFGGDGVIGTGYPSKGMMLRVFDDSGNGTDADAAAAMYFAADNGADIISISLGDTSYSQLFQDACTYAFQKGSLVIASGNENGSGGGALGPIYPAACTSALAVSANGPGELPATTYAGTGNYVSVSAPGGDLITDGMNYYVIQFVFSTATEADSALSQDQNLYPPYTLDYTYLAGTSMATPIVSGAASLYYGLNHLHQADGYSNLAAYQAIETSADGVMGAPYGGWETNQGYGSLNIQSLLSGTATRASQVGSIRGLVYSNGTPVANVAVKAQKTTGGLKYSTTTGSDGTFRFDALPPGAYNVTAAPFGQVKTKQAVVVAGCDVPGFDFWCGSYTGDDTPPTIAKFAVQSVSSSTVTFNQWGYDTETGIDQIQVSIGTTAGAADVVSATSILPTSIRYTLSGLSLPSGKNLFLNITYTDGAGLTTSASTQIQSTTFPVSGSVTLQDYSATVAGQVVHVEVRSPGSTTALEAHDVTLNASGGFSFTSNHTGTYDISFKASHWLRNKITNVSISSTGASGLTTSLINGDINGDNRIDIGDYSVLSSVYRTTKTSPNWNPNADLNGDGRVDLGDYGILSKNYRKSGVP